MTCAQFDLNLGFKIHMCGSLPYIIKTFQLPVTTISTESCDTYNLLKKFFHFQSNSLLPAAGFLSHFFSVECKGGSVTVIKFHSCWLVPLTSF